MLLLTSHSDLKTDSTVRLHIVECGHQHYWHKWLLLLKRIENCHQLNLLSVELISFLLLSLPSPPSTTTAKCDIAQYIYIDIRLPSTFKTITNSLPIVIISSFSFSIYVLWASSVCWCWVHLRKIQGMDAPPRGKPSPRGRGGSPPCPALWGGGVPRPAPPRKNDQNRGEVAGQNKYLNLNFLQKRKQAMEQYYNTEQCPTQPVNRICKKK